MHTSQPTYVEISSCGLLRPVLGLNTIPPFSVVIVCMVQRWRSDWYVQPINRSCTLWNPPLTQKPLRYLIQLITSGKTDVLWQQQLHNSFAGVMYNTTHSALSQTKKMSHSPVLTWGSKNPQCNGHSLLHGYCLPEPCIMLHSLMLQLSTYVQERTLKFSIQSCSVNVSQQSLPTT